MAEPKPLASLTSGLLARKGAAQPAMRRPMPGFGFGATAAVQQDDLGWNDMGFDVEPVPLPMDEAPVATGLTPMPISALVTQPETAAVSSLVPPVVIERQELAERIAAPRKVAPAAPRKAAFTLRLDADRHLKLRLACAITGRSAQQTVTQALDIFLNGLPELDRLTQQLPRRAATSE
ncbi:MAG: hypothetical protein V4512_13095 [Pseudomonadota bacterium]